ncbi:hypothetical protein FBU59_000001 [Linderina macrospora]|uniref:Uncharacterized protein n=1 Tax=Linderina macrospora TaxID=4868 RepID=A0ACC1JHS6_9FUNG|nr:hypothetical protein FBU59_000001 [Linderina macrospora]
MVSVNYSAINPRLISWGDAKPLGSGYIIPIFYKKDELILGVKQRHYRKCKDSYGKEKVIIEIEPEDVLAKTYNIVADIVLSNVAHGSYDELVGGTPSANLDRITKEKDLFVKINGTSFFDSNSQKKSTIPTEGQAAFAISIKSIFVSLTGVSIQLNVFQMVETTMLEKPVIDLANLV